MKKILNWTGGVCGLDKNYPERMIPANVPGNIQLDFAIADNYKDLNVDDNFHQFDWMEDRYFLYEALLPTVETGQRMIFKALGIDYEFEILVNGESIYHYEGMFKTTELDITDYLKGNDVLGVLIYPSPKIEAKLFPQLYRSNASECCKPAVCYGWDFHPQLVVSGIWDEAYVIITDKPYISDWNIDTVIADDLGYASGNVTVEIGNASDCEVKLEINSPYWEQVFESVLENAEKIEFGIYEPELWWPNGYGEQRLYEFRVSLLQNGETVDSVTFKRGFRKLELVPYEGCWDEPIIFPCPSNKQPLTFKINNKVIFAQGTNWVAPKIFNGEINREIYEQQLTYVKNANMNIVRSWGGAIINKVPFFELCDEYGILVWQDFPLGCNNYDGGGEKYLKTLSSEARAIIKKVKKHTCLALWSGGNELFTEWSRMTIQSKAVRQLGSDCYIYDPETPFIPTSPISDFVHGSYKFRYDEERDIMQALNGCVTSGYNELGCAGAAFMDTIEYVIPPEQLNLESCKKGTAWDTHHATGAWVGDSHLYISIIEHYFGKQTEIADVVNYSQLLQSIAYKYAYEEARRQSPRCSVIMNWCLNEPWPSVANNNVIDYKGRAKPAYYAICEALRPFMPSIRYERFDYRKGDTLKLQVWLLSQLPHEAEGRIKVAVEIDGKSVILCDAEVNEGLLERNKQLFDTEYVIDCEKQGLFTVSVAFTDKNGETLKSEYTMLCRG